MIEDLEEKFASGFFKKTSIDKLTWKNEIAEAHRFCRHNLKNMNILPDAIDGLVTTIYFDIEGYKLKETIDNIFIDALKKGQKMIDEIRNNLGRAFYYRNVNIARLRIAMEKWYWTYVFKELTQLLGEKNLLLETERKIPYKSLGRMTHAIQER